MPTTVTTTQTTPVNISAELGNNRFRVEDTVPDVNGEMHVYDTVIDDGSYTISSFINKVIFQATTAMFFDNYQELQRGETKTMHYNIGTRRFNPSVDGSKLYELLGCEVGVTYTGKGAFPGEHRLPVCLWS